MKLEHPSPLRFVLSGLSILSAWGLLATARSSAQDAPVPEPAVMDRVYKEITEVNGQPVVTLSSAEKSRYNVIKETGDPAPEQILFDKNANNEIAYLTWKSKRGEITKQRDKIKKDLIKLGGAQSQAAHTQYNAVLVKLLPAIALSDDYDPVVRVNCMLLLGMVDQKEPSGTQTDDAVPLASVLKILHDTLLDKKQIDAVRIAALDGILRHAELSPSLDTNVMKTLVDIVGASNPILGTSPEAHKWMRRRAVQALSAMAARDQMPADGVVAIGQLLGDKDASILARCDAMQALGGCSKGRFSGAKLKDITLASGNLLLEIAETAEGLEVEELVWPANFLTAMAVGYNGPENQPDRGLHVASVGDNETRQMVGELSKHNEALLLALRTSKPDLNKIRSLFDSKALEIEAWLKAKGAPAAAAPAPGVPELIVPAPK